jgi:aspartyl-tRNA(Asn)/glutamyl-tRNA(Gln) amidotransferase subunit A
MSLIDLSATELVASLRAGDVSSVDATRAYLDRIAALNSKLNAFLRFDADRAVAAAKAIDERRARGESLGLLAGLPVAVKDVLCTEGEPTTCASRMLEKFVPPYDATVIAKLRAADAVLIGKTNMDEFAMGGSGENSAFGPTRNPHDPERITGGSSSGSAAAVAARMAPVAIGSDTGGSIRQPAGLCGITGLKPTYGRVSRYGLVAFASSLDQVGPMARNAEDAALLLEAIAGHDPLDSTSLNVPTERYSETVRQPLEKLRLGVAREHFGEGLDAEVAAAVREAIEVYRSLGATIVDISLPHAKYAVATYYIIAPCEASSNLARYDGAHYGHRTDERAMQTELEGERKVLAAAVMGATNAGEKAADKAAAQKRLDNLDSPLVRMYRQSRSEAFGSEVKRRIMLGAYALSAGYYDAYYLKALKVRRLIRKDYDEAFQQVEAIIGPVTATPAYKIGEKANDPLAMYLDDIYTVSANLVGGCGIAFACGASKGGLPVGVQLQGPPLGEDLLLRAAGMFQVANDSHKLVQDRI